MTFVDKSLALVERSLSLVYSKHAYYLLLPMSPTCFKRVFSEADCGLLNFTRVDQELREDPELDNDGYSL